MNIAQEFLTPAAFHRCEGWEALLDRLLVLLGVPDDGLVTMGNTEQWWVREWREPGLCPDALDQKAANVARPECAACD